MASNKDEARDALYKKIAEAANQIGTRGHKAADESSRLEALARAYALVSSGSEPGKAW